MSIQIIPAKNLFTLHTAHTSYQMWADERGILHHLYYGPAIGDDDLRPTEFYSDCGFSPNPAGVEVRDYSLDTMSQEYTGCGVGDYRISCLSVSNGDGSPLADLRFVEAKLLPGKYSLPGLPAAFDEDGDCQTLRVVLKDAVTALTVTLLYGVYEKADVITRAAILENGGTGTIRLHKAASACLDLPFGEWELIHFHGRHCMERQPQRAPLPFGIQTRALRPGRQQPPSQSLCHPVPRPTPPRTPATAWAPCWSTPATSRSNASVSQLHSTRLIAGISDDDFCWTLGSRRVLHHPGGACSATPPRAWASCPASITAFCSTASSAAPGKTVPVPSSSTTGRPPTLTLTDELHLQHRQAGR